MLWEVMTEPWDWAGILCCGKFNRLIFDGDAVSGCRLDLELAFEGGILQLLSLPGVVVFEETGIADHIWSSHTDCLFCC